MATFGLIIFSLTAVSYVISLIVCVVLSFFENGDTYDWKGIKPINKEKKVVRRIPELPLRTQIKTAA